jgi:hypothetical protein
MEDSIENITEDKTPKVEESIINSKSTKEIEKPIINIKSTEKVEAKYPLNDLIDSCKALGYKKEIVAGAFFNYKNTEMTRKEFQETIKNFLRKKVK